MPLSRHVVLRATVELHRESGEPVSKGTLAESLDASEAALSEQLDSLCEFELLEATARGFRPTVTTRDLLAAGIELEEVVVLDVVEE